VSTPQPTGSLNWPPQTLTLSPLETRSQQVLGAHANGQRANHGSPSRVAGGREANGGGEAPANQARRSSLAGAKEGQGEGELRSSRAEDKSEVSYSVSYFHVYRGSHSKLTSRAPSGPKSAERPLAARRAEQESNLDDRETSKLFTGLLGPASEQVDSLRRERVGARGRPPMKRSSSQESTSSTDTSESPKCSS